MLPTVVPLCVRVSPLPCLCLPVLSATAADARVLVPLTLLTTAAAQASADASSTSGARSRASGVPRAAGAPTPAAHTSASASPRARRLSRPSLRARPVCGSSMPKAQITRAACSTGSARSGGRPPTRSSLKQHLRISRRGIITCDERLPRCQRTAPQRAG